MKCLECNKEYKKVTNDFKLCSKCHVKFEQKWMNQGFAYNDKNWHKHKAVHT